MDPPPKKTFPLPLTSSDRRRTRLQQRQAETYDPPESSRAREQTDPQQQTSGFAEISTDVDSSQLTLVDGPSEEAFSIEPSELSTQVPQFASQMGQHSSPPQAESTYSSPRPQQYQLVSPGTTSDPRTMSQNNKDQLIHSLRTHRVNTITELRRIEKIFAYLDSAEVTQPMTAAWAHYVDSNNLLNELRGLTKDYPFSSECLDEAKALVVRDPQSVRSWNYCWLVLLKMEKEGLVNKYARALAAKPAMWGGRQATAEGMERLANACSAEWTRALRQMLRHWDKPPSTTGH